VGVASDIDSLSLPPYFIIRRDFHQFLEAGYDNDEDLPGDTEPPQVSSDAAQPKMKRS